MLANKHMFCFVRAHGSQSGMILFPRGHLTVTEDIFYCHTRETWMLQAPSE